MTLAPRRPKLPPAPEEKFTWAPAWRLAQLVKNREVSPVDIVEHFLARIELLDQQLHAFRSIDHDGARRQARELELRIAAGGSIGPLAGVPVALKEFLAVEGMAWQNLLKGELSIAPRDGIEAERLRAAGAIIIGTTVSGLTAREFGASEFQPHNPWDDARVCGDSSSGAACAVASAMVPLAFTTDGLGSTRLPAAYCGLVGLLATRGRVPAADWTQLTSRLIAGVGPLARDVRDVARGLSVIAGPDSRDFFCLPDVPPDYEADLETATEAVRLGWTDDFGYAGAYAGSDSVAVIEAVQGSLFTLKRTADLQVESVELRFEDPSWAGSQGLVGDPGLSVFRQPPRPDVIRLRETRALIARQFDEALRSVDFLVSPTAQHIAPTRPEWKKAWLGESGAALTTHMAVYSAHTAAANVIGYPAMSIPAGFVTGMPVGLQIIGRPGSEKWMLQLAWLLETHLCPDGQPLSTTLGQA